MPALLRISGQLKIKALLMVVTLEVVVNTNLLVLSIKARWSGRKKILNAGVVLVWLRICVRAQALKHLLITMPLTTLQQKMSLIVHS
ncbi:hypothetical protein D3C73_798280 [compost metagenome]